MNNMTEQDTFVRDMEKRVRRLDTEFTDLVGKADSAEQDVRAQLEAMLNDFVTRREALQRRLGEARVASDAAREELADGLETTWNDLSDAFNRARAEFIRSA